MGTSLQLFKCIGFYSLQNIEKFLMHALGAHLHCRKFDKSILIIKTQSSPSVDVVDDWLSILLSSVCKLHHADDTPSVVKAIEKVLSSCTQLSIDSGSRSVYQSKVFPLRVRMNYFTNKSPRVPTVSHVSMK
ncbi:hypothetical protein E5676_scaffold322G00650 [Cucumis melo var. makuwa]|uniref:Uncharacterized protein n=1 Tax=Cucumis melo var. makuwa TaxID=1194695 RepID=A0A5D3DU11_CUCMM|nr:hypothetical protein E6C27_scaffold121G00090 [Cucumis melo var. makuwa]TYK26992.1 hypothetical protein E5676_scaffold322G00650 [Cucumis melo var. makuwa]